MVYESSYESGRQPFLPDATRGKWLNPSDFIYAGMSLVFRADIISMTVMGSMGTGIIAFIPAYLISIAMYIVPLMVIQSFLGQFSNSGFISAFRISPMFKGIGYVSLVTNVIIQSYHSIFAIVPLLYMFGSMNPTMPWSCEGFKMWAQNLTDNEETNLCNIQLHNETDPIENSGEWSNETMSSYSFKNHHIPSVLYFQYLFHDANIFYYDDFDFSMSWQLIICALLVWAIVAIIVYKFFGTEMIGTIVRYSVWIVLGLMAFFLIAFSFLPGASLVYSYSFSVDWHDVIISLTGIPIYGLSSFGAGWGIFVTLSSFNRFKTNLIKSSCLIALGQFAIMLGLVFLTKFGEAYFVEKTGANYYSYMEHSWILYLSSGSVLAHMPWANFWSVLFFFMLFWSNLILLVLQLHSILTTIFDEFANLREKKLDASLGLVCLMAAISIYFSSNHGITYCTALVIDTYITQIAINLLLILIVLWIYGRERFQRDFTFMTNHHFTTWSVNILRFVVPLALGGALIGAFIISYYEHVKSTFAFNAIAIIFIALPWTLIPGFSIYQMKRSMGTIKVRFLRCCRPTDWFPVEAEDRQKYEEAMGNVDITHTLQL